MEFNGYSIFYLFFVFYRGLISVVYAYPFYGFIKVNVIKTDCNYTLFHFCYYPSDFKTNFAFENVIKSSDTHCQN